MIGPEDDIFIKIPNIIYTIGNKVTKKQKENAISNILFIIWLGMN
jgi:hypothetical protein